MYNSYEVGVKQGWQAAGRKGTPSGLKKPDTEKIMRELTPQNESHVQTLTKIREELQGQVRAMWEAFSEVCQEDMGLELETLIAVFYPPALEWLETDLTEDAAVNEDMKATIIEIMRNYWQQRAES